MKRWMHAGSCWAFSTVAAVEGINQIVTGNLTALSEQELINCDTSYNSGCNGGLMDYAFSYIASSSGLHTEDDYPYLMEEGTCDEQRVTIYNHQVFCWLKKILGICLQAKYFFFFFFMSLQGELDVVTISGYEDVPENSEQDLLRALAKQPVSVAIEASGRDFQFYSGVSLYCFA